MRARLAFIALLAFAWAAAAALEQGQELEEGAFANGSLQAEISLNGTTVFEESPAPVLLSVAVENPSGSPLEVWFAVYDEESENWVVVEKIGDVPARGRADLDYNASFQYAGLTTEDTRIAIVAEKDGAVVGRSFSVLEQWGIYEGYLKGGLFGVGLVAVPVAGLVLVALFLLAVIVARSRRRKPKEGDEYTLRTLFLPHVKGRPISEIIADLLINPVFWMFEAGCGLMLVLIILVSSLASIQFEIALLVFVIGGLVCWLMPLTYLSAMWLLDLWEREPLRFPFSLFMWGIVAAFIAFWVNTIIDLVLGVLFGIAIGPVGAGLVGILTAILVAPVVEELSKGFGVLIASGHHEVNNTYDGLLYGFAAGLGFAAIENWFYFAVQNNPASAGGIGGWLFLVTYRSLFNSLGHGWFTASTGAVIGFMKGRRSLRRYAILGFVPGVLIAMALHAAFNFFAVVDAVVELVTQMPIFIFNPTLVVVLTAIYVAIIVLALLESRGKAREEG